MNAANQRIRAIAAETVRLTHREIELSLQRISRIKPVMESSQTMIDRTKEMLDATARLIRNGNATENGTLHHFTDYSSAMSKAAR